ncbi:MAG TPA: hypothetical protein VHE34_10595 [Puia sp.]|uniref:hypothetical protein n=1 Tax=Puia sp. TaxID=2045100 RepID=UPI002BB71FD1|nr:hypothetical protein [Puia sp.]HVU95665.1 hypothetical protein [Puia sp.]
MPFRKLSDFEQDPRGNPVPPLDNKSGTSPGFAVADKTFSFATATTAILTSGIVLLPLVLRIPLDLKLSDADLQGLSQITSSLGAFMIAIPLFLKDLHRGSNFWRQFFLIATTYVLATGAGVFAFLRNAQPEENITGSALLAFIFVASIALNAAGTYTTYKSNRPIRLFLSMELSFATSLILLIVSSWLARGDRFTIVFLLLSLYGFYLTLVLITTLLIQIFRNSLTVQDAVQPPLSSEDRLRTAIAELANENIDHALLEPQLLRLLKTTKFPDNPSIVSDTMVSLLVSRMDADTDPNHPLITIFSSDKIIPRWKNEMESAVNNSGPTLIALPYHSNVDIVEYRFKYLIDDYEDTTKHYQKQIITIISESTGFSMELLSHNISWADKYFLAKFMHVETNNSYRREANIILFLDQRSAEWFTTTFHRRPDNHEFSMPEWRTLLRYIPPSKIFIAEDLRDFLPLNR